MTLYEIIGLVLPLVVPIVLFQLLPILILLERRGAAFIQDRPGPYRAGINLSLKNVATLNLGGILGLQDDPNALRLRAFGAIFTMADGVKLLFKEHLTPPFVSKGYYMIGPMIPLLCGLLTPALLPFFAPMAYVSGGGEVAWLSGQTITTSSGILLLFAMGSLSVYGIVLGSWASNSKYSLLGGMRASAMMISYEVSMGLAAMGMLLLAGSLSLTDVVEWQGHHTWGIVVQPIAFFCFLVCMFAECNRNPFDVAEGESEIVAGFHTEMNGVRFMLYMSAEYLHMVIAGVLMAVLFLGGYHLLPFPLPLNGLWESWVTLDTLWVKQHLGLVLGLGVIGAGLALAFASFLVWRKRAGQARRLPIYKPTDGNLIQRELGLYGTLFAAGAIVHVLGGAAIIALLKVPAPEIVAGTPIWAGWVNALTAFVQFNVVITKALLLAWLFIWVRWTLPRFRYDQIMGIGWKVLLNVALVNLLVTAILAKLIA